MKRKATSKAGKAKSTLLKNESAITPLKVNSNYKSFLADIKKRYQLAQLKASRAVHQELIGFY